MAVIKSSNYSVFVTSDIVTEINTFLKDYNFSKIVVLVDENTIAHCYPQLVSGIPAFEKAEIIELESGEENKTIEICTQLWLTLEELGVDRKSLIVNLGGGVIGDMGGFVASTFKRGIPFINIPTTLLAQVDAAVGGKVGVDLNYLKNLVGLFSNPLAVFVDSAFLHTLNEKQRLSGFVEMLKHALIADTVYWKKLKTANLQTLDDFNTLIETSIHIKNKIVLTDPYEKNIRKMLNFGHTVGHAVETCFLEQQQPILHGEAIAVGIICESFLSHKLLGLSTNELKEIVDIIVANYFPIALCEQQIDHIVELMFHDKKNTGGQINFSLLSSIGTCEINQTIPTTELLKEALNYYKNC